MFTVSSLLLLSPALGATPDAATPDAEVVASISLSSEGDLRGAYDAKWRECMLSRSPACEADMASLALRIAGDGRGAVRGRMPLSQGAHHLSEAVRLEEVRAPDGDPSAYYPAVFGFLDQLAGAAGRGEGRQEAGATAAGLVRLADRLERTPLLDDIGGSPGVAYRDKARRAARLMALEPGNARLLSVLWKAELVLDRSFETYGPGGEGPGEVSLMLREAEQVAQTKPGRCAVMQTWARHHTLELRYDRNEDVEDAAARAISASLQALECDVPPGSMPLAQRQILTEQIAYASDRLIGRLLEQGRVRAALDALRQVTQAPIKDLPWAERDSFVFSWTGEIWQVLSAGLGAGLDDREFQQVLDDLYRLADGAMVGLYAARPDGLDPVQRERLVDALDSYAGLCELRGRQDLAARARQLRDELPAAMEGQVSVPTVSEEPVYPALSATGRLARDAALLAGLAGESAFPGDARGERFLNRAAILEELEAVVRELDARWRQPGALGLEAHADYVQALMWLGLAYESAGATAAAGLVFEQVDVLDALAVDAPLGADGLSARRLRERWSRTVAPETRPLIVHLPDHSGPLQLSAGDRAVEVVDLATRDLEWNRGGWFAAGGNGDGRWVFTAVPVDEAVSLTIDAQPLALPDGGDGLIVRVEQVDREWTLADVGLPFSTKED